MTTSRGGSPSATSGTRTRRSTSSSKRSSTGPRRRDSWVHRDRLVEALDRAVTHPVTLVAAPAGYGKTTVVAQWLAERGGPGRRMGVLDPGDNDPDRLWTHVAAALERAGCVLPAHEPPAWWQPPAHRSADGPAGTLDALAAMPDDIVLVLDDFHFVQSPACHEQVEFLIAGPARHRPTWSSSPAPTPVCGWGGCARRATWPRSGPSDLSFTSDEAAELLADDDVHLPEATVSQLMERTEGWPAGALPRHASRWPAAPTPTSSCGTFSGGQPVHR